MTLKFDDKDRIAQLNYPIIKSVCNHKYCSCTGHICRFAEETIEKILKAIDAQ